LREVVVRFFLCIAVASVMLARAVACAEPLTLELEHRLKPKDTFRECADCPEMVVVPAGAFTMGSPADERERGSDEGPQRTVTIGRPFAVGKLHVTVAQFAAFVRETGYMAGTACAKWPSGSLDGSWRNPGFAQKRANPVVCVSWSDAKAYADWLANKTGKPYRLLSEAEWEYAARGRTQPGAYPRFWFGDNENDLCRYGNGADQKAQDAHVVTFGASCSDEYAYTAPAGHYRPNAFGLYDMAGNARQWTADCYHDSYNAAPDDGSAWTGDNCKDAHVARGGSWGDFVWDLRVALRHKGTDKDYLVGFRLARTLAL
jgi:formylglycine-generating enzyme required for sulfatase activity